MANILVVDDEKKKVKKLQELLVKLDPTGSQHTIITPIIPRESDDTAHDDKSTVLTFLEQTGLEGIDVIFQDKNLGGGLDGRNLISEYKNKGYDGPIISYTAADWTFYQHMTDTDIKRGCTHVFPWGNKFEAEQIEFLRDILD